MRRFSQFNSRPLARGGVEISHIIAFALAGVLILISSGAFEAGATAKRNAEKDRQALLNQTLATVLLDYARTVSTTGQLPAPVVSGNLKSTVYDGSDANMLTLLSQARITAAEANGDGTPGDKVRVYQRITGLTRTMPLYDQSGPQVTLSYELGALYSTDCQRSDTCNTGTSPTTTYPGNSTAWTSANYTTWKLNNVTTTQSTDYGLAAVTTLPLQKQRLTLTIQRIEAIRDRMQELFREKQRQADANDTTNYYPRPSTAALRTASFVATTTDCHNDGWYRLDNSDILAQVGLTSDYGLTAWGGKIHFCPDYDITGAAGNDSPPHFAALRFSNAPSAAGTLDPTAASNAGNIVITF